MTEKKKIDWEKRYKNLRKRTRKESDQLREIITDKNREIMDCKRKKKNMRSLHIGAQSFSELESETAREKAKLLIDAGLWFMELK